MSCKSDGKTENVCGGAGTVVVGVSVNDYVYYPTQNPQLKTRLPIKEINVRICDNSDFTTYNLITMLLFQKER